MQGKVCFTFGKATPFKKPQIPSARKGIMITHLKELLSNPDSEKHSFLSWAFSHTSKLETRSVSPTYIAVSACMKPKLAKGRNR